MEKESRIYSAATVSNYLQNIDFPADKEHILTTARESGAPDFLMRYLEDIPDTTYGNVVEVSKAIDETANH